ncbi:spore coat protein [Paenibacillus chartarius]|uniref:Spore coat protein n=1 Tax=Paenibacillus chartarius TaxID=747481 RepID=A0ABV6DG50_9BACL
MNKLGAHEVLELHEVLSDAIHGLNTLKLYRPHAKDPQLQALVDRHMSAMTMDYNNMVQMATHQNIPQAIPTRLGAAVTGMVPADRFQPAYGLRHPQTQSPAPSIEEINDEDVMLCLVNCHKQTAALKMKAALEMANPMLRRMVQQSANASADMAYEAFQAANQRGIYQVPTLQETTQANFIHAYAAAPAGQHHMPLM